MSDTSSDDVGLGEYAHHWAAQLASATRAPNRVFRRGLRAFSAKAALDVRQCADNLKASPRSGDEGLEAVLTNQVHQLLDAKSLEMEAYEQLLSGSILELRRVRAYEEARLGNRVSAASERFAGALAQLQAQYQAQVDMLKRDTLNSLACYRDDCEASVAARAHTLAASLHAATSSPYKHSSEAAGVMQAQAETDILAGGLSGGWSRHFPSPASPGKVELGGLPMAAAAPRTPQNRHSMGGGIAVDTDSDGSSGARAWDVQEAHPGVPLWEQGYVHSKARRSTTKLVARGIHADSRAALTLPRPYTATVSFRSPACHPTAPEHSSGSDSEDSILADCTFESLALPKAHKFDHSSIGIGAGMLEQVRPMGRHAVPPVQSMHRRAGTSGVKDSAGIRDDNSGVRKGSHAQEGSMTQPRPSQSVGRRAHMSPAKRSQFGPRSPAPHLQASSGRSAHGHASLPSGDLLDNAVEASFQVGRGSRSAGSDYSSTSAISALYTAAERAASASSSENDEYDEKGVAKSAAAGLVQAGGRKKPSLAMFFQRAYGGLVKPRGEGDEGSSHGLRGMSSRVVDHTPKQYTSRRQATVRKHVSPAQMDDRHRSAGTGRSMASDSGSSSYSVDVSVLHGYSSSHVGLYGLTTPDGSSSGSTRSSIWSASTGTLHGAAASSSSKDGFSSGSSRAMEDLLRKGHGHGGVLQYGSSKGSSIV